MANGMELMLGSMLKNMGIDKDVLMGHANNAQSIITNLDSRFTAMESRLRFIEEKLDVIYEAIIFSDSYEKGLQHDPSAHISNDSQLELGHGLRIVETNRAATAADFEPHAIEVNA